MSQHIKQLPVETIVKLYKSGESLKSIAKRYCVSPTTISNRIRGAGQEVRKGKSTKPLNSAYVKERLQQMGLCLLDVYKNSIHKMKCRCNACNNIVYICWNNFQQGHGCPKCGIANRVKKRKMDIATIEQRLTQLNITLLDNQNYDNSSTPLKCFCGVCKNYITVQWGSIKQGCGCKVCGRHRAKEKISRYNHYNWNKDRNAVKERKLFRSKCKFILHRCLNVIQSDKVESTYKLLGYNADQLMSRIKNHSNWSRIQKSGVKWHIDHIFPIKAFLDNGIRDIKLVNHLENLQPLEDYINLQKNSKYNKKEFKRWLKYLEKDEIDAK